MKEDSNRRYLEKTEWSITRGRKGGRKEDNAQKLIRRQKKENNKRGEEMGKR